MQMAGNAMAAFSAAMAAFSGHDRRIAWRRAHDIYRTSQSWTRFRSHRDLAVEGVMCLDLDFLARRHLDRCEKGKKATASAR